MLISVCIPHYNRSEYLKEVLRSIAVQTFPNIEVIVSDDASTDGSSREIPRFLESLVHGPHARFEYRLQPTNLGYDANLRSALNAATGDYLLILGNDDALADAQAIERLVFCLRDFNYPEVCYTSFRGYSDGIVTNRASKTGIVGAGPAAAVRTFRSFSCVCGVVMKAIEFRKWDTAEYDGSIFVQVYLAARIIASGGRVCCIADPLVAKDVLIEGQHANSYRDNLREMNRKSVPKTGGLDEVGRLAWEAIVPYLAPEERKKYFIQVFRQLIIFSYGYWLYKYRENGSYRAALNLARGCRPCYLYRKLGPLRGTALVLDLWYAIVTVFGLTIPTALIANAAPVLYRFSRRVPVMRA